MSGRILILGASGRAAAGTIRRAGLQPFVIDLFADADTRKIAVCLRCPFEDYPTGLFQLARSVPPMPWIYTGGLENYPDLIGELARERELIGNGPEILNLVRDPFRLADFLKSNGFRVPELRPSNQTADLGRWLRKPLRGSAGFGIRFANVADADSYLQEFVPGLPMSAAFKSTDSQCELLGVSRILSGEPWLHARPFAYAGNIGPITVSERLQYRIRELGTAFASLGMTGFWGFDFFPVDDEPVMLEVNPRYTASIELYEYSRGNAIVGKAIYYAPHSFRFPATGPWSQSLLRAKDVFQMPEFADIPDAGTECAAGQPVLTLFAEAPTESACRQQLQSRARELDELFGGNP